MNTQLRAKEMPPGVADSAKRRQIVEGARVIFLAHGSLLPIAPLNLRRIMRKSRIRSKYQKRLHNFCTGFFVLNPALIGLVRIDRRIGGGRGLRIGRRRRHRDCRPLLADSPEVAGGGRLPVRRHVQTEFPRQNGGVGFGLTGALAGRPSRALTK
jgi:hypothetical protein